MMEVDVKALTTELKSTVNLLVGEEALALFLNKDFLTEWEHLYNSCSWATVYQSKDYVVTWYTIYQQDYLPILVKAHHNGVLTGLLTLACHRKEDKFIIGAGHYDADYQTWLATNAEGDTFIKAALAAVLKKFPAQKIMLRHILANTPLNWYHNDLKWKKSCVLQPFDRPLMDSNIALSKQSRSRIEQLKKLGSFEKIIDKDKFISILEEHAYQFDFRQGALFNLNPFKDDPLKKKFLLALFDTKLMHVSTIMIKEKVISCLAATIGRNRAHLGGINFHASAYAKYSPGYVHFHLLWQQLAQEGLDFFDLTPGDEFYKKRLATTYDQVYELVVTNSSSFYLKRLIKKIVYQQLHKSGIRPLSIKLYLKKKKYLLRNKGFQGFIADYLSKNSKNSHIQVYSPSEKLFKIKTKLPIKKDSLSDLLEFENTNTRLTRWEFLEDAIKRVEKNEQVYTVADNGRLLFCAWGKTYESIKNESAALPPGSFIIEAIYCHPDAQENLMLFLASVANEILEEKPSKPLYLFAESNANLLCQILKESDCFLFQEKLTINKQA